MSEASCPARSTRASGPLLRKDLIRPDRGDLGEDDAYRFRHLLVRDAVYDAMPKELRAALHEAFADWLEREARSGAGAGRVRGLPPRAVVPVPGGARSRRRRGTRDRLPRGCASARGGRTCAGTGRRRGGRTAPGPRDGAAACRRPSCALGDAVPRTGAVLRRSARASARVSSRRASVRAADAGAETVGRPCRDPSRLAARTTSTRSSRCDRRWRRSRATWRRSSPRAMTSAWPRDGRRSWVRSDSGSVTVQGSLEAIERGHAHAERAGSERLMRLTTNELLGPFVWGPVPTDEVVRRASALIAEIEASGSASFELRSVARGGTRDAGRDRSRGCSGSRWP